MLYILPGSNTDPGHVGEELAVSPNSPRCLCYLRLPRHRSCRSASLMSRRHPVDPQQTGQRVNAASASSGGRGPSLRLAVMGGRSASPRPAPAEVNSVPSSISLIWIVVFRNSSSKHADDCYRCHVREGNQEVQSHLVFPFSFSRDKHRETRGPSVVLTWYESTARRRNEICCQSTIDAARM